MRKKIIFSLIAAFIIIGSAVLVTKSIAQEITGAVNIQYPIKELGNCQSKAGCKAYCDKPENIEACLNFAEKNGLMAKEEIATAKKFMATDVKKPGACTTKDSCEEYCNDISHIDECLAFAQENNLVPPKDLEEAKKVQAAIKKGVKPPACGNKKTCDTFCDSPEHMEECITFGEAAGFIQGKELEDAQKMLAAVKRGIKPPPCKGKQACDEYCSDPSNMEMCMTFAMEAGFMTEQEKADSQKMLVALKKGIKPPACKGKEECDIYCQQEEHFEECLNFAEAAGFMNPEEAAMSRKTGGKGPGNCKGKEECEAFCNNPNNQEICFNFGKEHGLIPEEDLKRMEEGKQQFKQSLEQAPQEVLDCLSSQLGSDMMEKLKSGTVMPPREIGESMRTCFEKMGPPPGQGGPGGKSIMPPEQTGPGGCKTPEECKIYCETNLEECQNFQPMMPQGAPGIPQNQQGAPAPGQIPTGPGGCKTSEECQLFCAANPQECQNFKGPIMGPVPGAGGESGAEGTLPYGEPGEFIRTQPACETPEQCQQIQQPMPIPNQMAPQQFCQGENCNYGPAPTEEPFNQQQLLQPQMQPQLPAPTGQNSPSQMQPAPQPPTGGYPSQMPPPSGSMPRGGSMPTDPYPNQPQPQQYQQSPQQPAPGGTTPPPSGFLAPKTFLGSIISIFNQVLHLKK